MINSTFPQVVDLEMSFTFFFSPYYILQNLYMSLCYF